ncbi:hypothetical protein BKA93DRAFT_756340 [Sparassis latifolia]
MRRTQNARYHEPGARNCAGKPLQGLRHTRATFRPLQHTPRRRHGLETRANGQQQQEQCAEHARTTSPSSDTARALWRRPRERSCDEHTDPCRAPRGARRTDFKRARRRCTLSPRGSRRRSTPGQPNTISIGRTTRDETTPTGIAQPARDSRTTNPGAGLHSGGGFALDLCVRPIDETPGWGGRHPLTQQKAPVLTASLRVYVATIREGRRPSTGRAEIQA